MLTACQARLLVGFCQITEPYDSSAAIREFDAKYRNLIQSTSA